MAPSTRTTSASKTGSQQSSKAVSPENSPVISEKSSPVKTISNQILNGDEKGAGPGTILKNPGIELKTGIASLSEDDIQSIEENLFDNDLEKYIHEAKLEGDYKLAIRFSFIYIIRLLDENGIIKWRKQKTNYDYLKELEGNPFKDSFNYCKLIFENLWYGSTSFSNSALIQTLDQYTGHINSLKSKAIN